MDDPRDAIYRELHGDQLVQEEQRNLRSAGRILDILFRAYRPASVLDVGCGVGSWLRAVSARGITDIQGIEGAWLDKTKLQIDPARVQIADLEKGFDLGRRFDLAINLEVAEHLSESAALGFVSTLTRHAPAVLFSAAIPFQGGHHHVNERFLDYWAALFTQHGYRPLDLIRAEIWNEQQVMWWLRQNILLFAHDDLIAKNERLREEAAISQRRPFSVVHPQIYEARLKDAYRQVDELARLRALVGEGGTFEVTVSPQGGWTVKRSG